MAHCLISLCFFVWLHILWTFMTNKADVADRARSAAAGLHLHSLIRCGSLGFICCCSLTWLLQLFTYTTNTRLLWHTVRAASSEGALHGLVCGIGELKIKKQDIEEAESWPTRSAVTHTHTHSLLLPACSCWAGSPWPAVTTHINNHQDVTTLQTGPYGYRAGSHVTSNQYWLIF